MGRLVHLIATVQQESVYSSWAGSSKLACLPERAAYTAAKVSSLSDTSYGLSRDTLMVLLPSRAQRMRLPLMLAGYTGCESMDAPGPWKPCGTCGIPYPGSYAEPRARRAGQRTSSPARGQGAPGSSNRSLRRYGTKITIAAVL